MQACVLFNLFNIYSILVELTPHPGLRYLGAVSM